MILSRHYGIGYEDETQVLRLLRRVVYDSHFVGGFSVAGS